MKLQETHAKRKISIWQSPACHSLEKTGRTYLRPLKLHSLAEKMEIGWGRGKGRGISSQGKPRSQ